MRKNITCYAALMGLIIALFFLYSYQRSLFFRPGSIHQWRQSDCLSIAKNYYEEGMDFFSPRIHYQGVPYGKAVSELPVLNYTAAALWKIFGEHEFIYRLLNYSIYILGLFLLLKVVYQATDSVWMALFCCAIPLTSPMMTYYSLNFMSDVPAFSLSLIAFCLLFKYNKNNRPSLFYLAVFIGFLAALMKASASFALLFTAFAGVTTLLPNRKWWVLSKGPGNKWSMVILLATACTLIWAWYSHALAYNGGLHNFVFLLTILPLWEMDQGQIINNWNTLSSEFLPYFLNRPMLIFLVALIIYVFIHFKKLEVFLRWAFVLSGLYMIGIMVLFFNVFDVHEYYLINIMIFPVITLFSAATIFSKSGFTFKYKKALPVFLTLILLSNALHASAYYRLRVFERDQFVQVYPFISKSEKEMADYLFWRYGLSTKRAEHLTPMLRQAGIRRSDFVLSIPDPSFNISLYLMDQKGFTISPYHLVEDSTVMDRFMKRVRYVVLTDTTLKKERGFRRNSRFFELYMRHEGTEIFKIKKRT